MTRLSDTSLREIAELEKLTHGRYAGWCVQTDKTGSCVAVDVRKRDEEGCDRYCGSTLREALKAARLAEEARR